MKSQCSPYCMMYFRNQGGDGQVDENAGYVIGGGDKRPGGYRWVQLCKHLNSILQVLSVQGQSQPGKEFASVNSHRC